MYRPLFVSIFVVSLFQAEMEISENGSSRQGEIVIYHPDESVHLDVRVENETVWLTLRQLSLLFGRDRTVIGRHISNIFKEGELQKDLVCAKFAHTGEHGRNKGFVQTRDVDYYNLDVIISVGYRVKSVRGTQFRQWALKVLKEYLIRGYAIHPRFEELERRVQRAEERIDFFIKTNLPPEEGVFYDGQLFEAYAFAAGLIRMAKKRIILIDNYIDETVLTLLDKRSPEVDVTVYTRWVTPQLQLDIDKHNSQYPAIEVCLFNKAHDRFLIVDERVYHVGASLKDLGKRWFAFSLMRDILPQDLLSRI